MRKESQKQSVSLMLWDAQLIPPDDDRTVEGLFYFRYISVVGCAASTIPLTGAEVVATLPAMSSSSESNQRP